MYIYIYIYIYIHLVDQYVVHVVCLTQVSIILQNVTKTAVTVSQVERQDVILSNATLSLFSTPLTRLVLVSEITLGRQREGMKEREGVRWQNATWR